MEVGAADFSRIAFGFLHISTIDILSAFGTGVFAPNLLVGCESTDVCKGEPH